MNEKSVKKPESKATVAPAVTKAVETKTAESKTVAPAVKPVETKAPEVKPAAASEVKTEEKPAAKEPVKAEPAKKEPVKKEAEKKEPVKKETAKKETEKKKPGRKPGSTNKKKENSTEVFVEFYGQQSSITDIQQKITDAFVAEGHRPSTIKTLKVYLKPEDSAAYYVINEKFAGRVDLF